MHTMLRNWNPKNQNQVDNTLRLVAGEAPEDLEACCKIARDKGFTIPGFIKPATSWSDFK